MAIAAICDSGLSPHRQHHESDFTSLHIINSFSLFCICFVQFFVLKRRSYFVSFSVFITYAISIPLLMLVESRRMIRSQMIDRSQPRPQPIRGQHSVTLKPQGITGKSNQTFSLTLTLGRLSHIRSISDEQFTALLAHQYVNYTYVREYSYNHLRLYKANRCEDYRVRRTAADIRHSSKLFCAVRVLSCWLRYL